MVFSKVKRRWVVVAVGVVLVVSLVFFVVGVVFIANRHRCSDIEKDYNSTSTESVGVENPCEHSSEAESSGLIEFLTKVIHTYHELSPSGVSFRFTSTPTGSNTQHSYGSHLLPSNIKNVTDSARLLLEELNSLNINVTLLRPREQKALAESRHVLEHNFAQPYDGDYYAGDWMLGPNHFCTQYICKLSYYVGYAITRSIQFYPRNAKDILTIRDTLAGLNETIYQYMENMRFGVTRGMVRTIEECLAGIDAIKGKYLNIVRFKSSGILNEWYVDFMLYPRFLAKLNGTDTEAEWYATNGQSVNESIRNYLVQYLGEPLYKFISFLENENILHCVPSNVSSGLATLPLAYVYYNGTRTNERTSPLLPTGETLEGRKAYVKILSFYTTTNVTAEEVHQLGWKQLNILYPQIVEIAKNITGELNESLAIVNFKDHISERNQYYNKEPFPKNESDAKARDRCRRVSDAKRFCPKRWASLQLWFDEARKMASQLDPQTCNLFYFSGSKHTTPNCPIEMNPNFNPSTAAQSYIRSDSYCNVAARLNLPFFIDNYGPRYQEMTINAHEARPGHHTQSQGYAENFKRVCPSSDPLIWLDAITYYHSFSEGWALYAENPLIAQDTDIYRNHLLKKFGMLKGQIWRALRLVVDTGLHYKGMKRDEALELFAKYALDTSDVAAKEVTRYQSNPGQATSYMIGQLSFINLRKYVRKHLGDEFNLREFHYQVLRHGSAPLVYIEDQIKKYVECYKDKNLIGCKYLAENTSGKIRRSAENEMEKAENELFHFRDLLEEERYY